MAIIYRKSDKVWLNIDDIKIAVSPLTLHEKSTIVALINDGKINEAAIECIALAVKDIKGVTTQDGLDYKFDIEDGRLSNENLNDIQNFGDANKLATVCLNLISGMPSEFTDAITGEQLTGVSFDIQENQGKK